MTKDFKMPIVKDLMRVHYNANNGNLVLFEIYTIIKITGTLIDNITYRIFRNCVQFLDHYINNIHEYKYNAMIPHLAMLLINFKISKNPNYFNISFYEEKEQIFEILKGTLKNVTVSLRLKRLCRV